MSHPAATIYPPEQIASHDGNPANSADAVQRLAAATAELAAGSEEAQASVELIENTMRSVTDIAIECRAAALQSLTGAKDIEASATGAVGATQSLFERVTGLRQSVITMNSDVSRLVDWVTVSVEGTMKSAKLIAGLERLSAEISDIVEVVVGIADQTNLLAFNAAIEAARARKHGLGFAVVADEVRFLAETSERAAEEIMILVTDIQTDVRNVAQDVTAIGETSTGEVEKARHIERDLKAIDGLMEKLNRSARDIQGMARTASGGAGEMRAACQAIADSIDKAAAASTQTTGAVAEQTKGLSHIADGAGRLAQIIEDVHSGNKHSRSGEVRDGAIRLSAAITQSAAAAEQIAAGVQQIDQSARELASSAEETLAGAQTVDCAASQALSEVKGAEQISGQVTQLLIQNNQNVQSLVAAIRGAALQNQSAVENIEKLEQRARQIEKIVDAIVAVATQTNLLALHGAIEAARAGKRGQGFAVVASDVRNLARESADAAEKIKSVVRDIQSQIMRVTKDVEAAGRAAHVQAEDAHRSTFTLVTVEQDMKVVHSEFSAIAGFAAGDVARARSVVAAMERVTILSESLGQLTRDASSAAGDSAIGMQELARAVGDISGVAKDL